MASFVPRISWSWCCYWKRCENGKVWSSWLILRFGRGTGGGYNVFSIACCVFPLLLIVLWWLVHDDFCIFFFVAFFFLCLWSLQLGVTSAWILLCLFCKTISKVKLIITLWVSLRKESPLISITLSGALDHSMILACWFVIPVTFCFRL